MKLKTGEIIVSAAGMPMGLILVLGSISLWKSSWINGLGFLIVFGTIVIAFPFLIWGFIDDSEKITSVKG